MTADKIRWGILSTANIGLKRVAPAIQASSNGTVVAVASRTQDSADAYAAQLGIPHAYGRYETLLSDPDIDAIYNPLPNHLHAEWSIKAAEARKPTLCEKPLARNAAEARAIVDAFESHGLLFAEAFMYRFHPQTERVRAMVAEGMIGNLQIISASFTFRLGPERAGDIRLKKEMGGGGLMDVGCYCINAMRLMTGSEPDRAAAHAVWGPETGVDEWLTGTLHFPGEILGHFDCGLRSQFANQVELRGDQGRIRVEMAFVGDAATPRTIRYWRGDSHYEEIIVPGANQYTLMVEDFGSAVLEGRPPRFPPADAVANMAVIDLLLESARES
jgi:predicted dehydrogenase